MQYFKPAQANQFVGDCMPFYRDGVFHLFYLLDESHHLTLNGLGGHQWALATSSDLITWTHHPLAIPITDEREGSICTGSVFFENGMYYGFYATRMRDYTQHLSLATSNDGRHFSKVEPNPFASPPPEYNPYHYRDPVVFHSEETGVYHMLVTAQLADYPLQDYGGCLAHLVSADLKDWQVEAPFLIPGLPGAPECPDYFRWHDWYYLIFSNSLVTRYRMSRQPFGPWHQPKVDVLDCAATRVMKTAPFNGDRRIGVAWIGTREADQDEGRFQWGGHAVFREITQHADGTLGTTFPTEMIPATDEALDRSPTGLTTQVITGPNRVHLQASQGLEVAMLSEVPQNVRLTMQVKPGQIQPGQSAGIFGLRLRAGDAFTAGYQLYFSPDTQTVTLFDQELAMVTGLDRPFTLDLILKADLIDLCLDGRRCLINRCPEQQGQQLYFFAHHVDVVFDKITLRPLPEPMSIDEG